MTVLVYMLQLSEQSILFAIPSECIKPLFVMDLSMLYRHHPSDSPRFFLRLKPFTICSDIQARLRHILHESALLIPQTNPWRSHPFLWIADFAPLTRGYTFKVVTFDVVHMPSAFTRSHAGIIFQCRLSTHRR